MKSTKQLGIVYFLSSIIFSILIDTLTKIIAHNISLHNIIIGRYAFAFLSMLIFFTVKKTQLFYKIDIKIEILRSLSYIIAFYLWALGIKHSCITLANIIILLHPLCTSIIAKFFLREQLDYLKVSLMIVIPTAVATIAQHVQNLSSSIVCTLPSTYLFFGMLFFVIGDVMTKKIAINNPNIYINIMLMHVLGLITTTILYMLLKKESLMCLICYKTNIKNVLLLIIIGIMSNISMFLFIKSLNIAQLNFLAPYMYCEIGIGLVVDYCIFGITPNKVTIIYGMIILGIGVALMLRDKQKIQKANHL